MDNFKLNLYKRFMNSISGFNGYKQLLYESAGKAVLFVFLITLLLGTVSIIEPLREFNAGISVFADNFDKQVPDFELKNGELTVEGQMPVIIKDTDVTIIIDTSDNADQSMLDDYDNAILLTKDQLIQKSYANMKSTDFNTFTGVTLNKESFRFAIPFIKWVIVFVVIFSVFFFIAGKFISALVISLVGMIANSSAKRKLKFLDIYRISLYSMTLPLILCTILNLTGIMNIVPLLLFYIISSVYTWGAIKSISKQSGEDIV